MIQMNGAENMSRVTTKAKSSKGNTRLSTRSGSATSVLALALLLGGCASYSKDHFKVGSVPSDYRTKHPIVVSQSEFTEDMIVTSDMKGMSHRQLNVVNSFLAHYRRAGAKSINIIVPSGSHNDAAARRVAHDIVAHMKKERVNGNVIRVSRYHAANHGDSATLRLSFDSLQAKVGSECGQWTDDLKDTHDNQNYNNFGCATQNNLAEMIVNPEDLVHPRGQSEIDAERRDNVINDWRDNGTENLPRLL